MTHTPLTKQRSPWEPRGPVEIIPGQPPALAWQRNVYDGHLTAFVADEPGIGWHMSISHRTNTSPPRPGRYPTWDEIVHARDRILPADIGFVMHLPPEGEFVAVHDTTFHLHQHPEPPT